MVLIRTSVIGNIISIYAYKYNKENKIILLRKYNNIIKKRKYNKENK